MVRVWHEFPPLALFWLLANSNQCEWQSKWIYESRPPNKRKTSLPGYKDKSLLWNKVALCLFRQQRGIAVRRRLHPPTLPSSFFIYYLLSSCKRRNYRIRNKGDGLQVGSSFWLRLQLRTSSNAIASTKVIVIDVPLFGFSAFAKAPHSFGTNVQKLIS